MVEHIEGPLYYERMGRSGPVMAFVHPNPMDQSCWIFQMAHLSTWYRCILGIDIPGYGRSPKATRGLTMSDMAQACWEAIDAATPNEGAPFWSVAPSVGSAIAPYMYHLRPQRTAQPRWCLSGAGFSPNKEHVPKRIAGYTERGIEYRWDFTFEGLSPAFRATPLAHFFATLFTERNAQADLQSIIYQFEAAANPEPADHHSGIACPTLILSGSEDHAHPRAFALKGRIHWLRDENPCTWRRSCFFTEIEQPWLFDRYMSRVPPEAPSVSGTGGVGLVRKPALNALPRANCHRSYFVTRGRLEGLGDRYVERRLVFRQIVADAGNPGDHCRLLVGRKSRQLAAGIDPDLAQRLPKIPGEHDDLLGNFGGVIANCLSCRSGGKASTHFSITMTSIRLT